MAENQSYGYGRAGPNYTRPAQDPKAKEQGRGTSQADNARPGQPASNPGGAGLTPRPPQRPSDPR